jgi:hypothetical protein
MAVINEESAAILAGDFDRYKATHLQDNLETRVEMGVYGYNVYKGWENSGSVMEDYLEGDPQTEAVVRMEDPILKVSGKAAWLTYHNIWVTTSVPEEVIANNLRIVFLEKVNGAWKISFTAYYTKGDLDEGI